MLTSMRIHEVETMEMYGAMGQALRGLAEVKTVVPRMSTADEVRHGVGFEEDLQNTQAEVVKQTLEKWMARDGVDMSRVRSMPRSRL